MHLIILSILCIFFSSCAKPNIVKQHFPPEKKLHMSRVKEVSDVTTLNQYVFYLNKGDSIPLKLELDSSLIEFMEPHVNLALKKKIFLRLEINESTTPEEIERILSLTPEKMAELGPDEMMALVKKFKIYLSQDGESWAYLLEKESVKEIFGLGSGSFNLGMAFSGDDGLYFLFSLIVKNKQAA